MPGRHEKTPFLQLWVCTEREIDIQWMIKEAQAEEEPALAAGHGRR